MCVRNSSNQENALMLQAVKEEKCTQLELEIKHNLNRAQIKLKHQLFKIMLRWNTNAEGGRSGRPEKQATTTKFETMCKEVCNHSS